MFLRRRHMFCITSKLLHSDIFNIMVFLLLNFIFFQIEILSQSKFDNLLVRHSLNLHTVYNSRWKPIESCCAIIAF